MAKHARLAAVRAEGLKLNEVERAGERKRRGAAEWEEVFQGSESNLTCLSPLFFDFIGQ